MTCPRCGGAMLALFLTASCERCDTAPIWRGWVIWRSPHPGTAQYVFRDRDGAERWARVAGLEGHPIRAVLSRRDFGWREGHGVVPGLWIAERHFEVHVREADAGGECAAWLEEQ